MSTRSESYFVRSWGYPSGPILVFFCVCVLWVPAQGVVCLLAAHCSRARSSGGSALVPCEGCYAFKTAVFLPSPVRLAHGASVVQQCYRRHVDCQCSLRLTGSHKLPHRTLAACSIVELVGLRVGGQLLPSTACRPHTRNRKFSAIVVGALRVLSLRCPLSTRRRLVVRVRAKVQARLPWSALPPKVCAPVVGMAPLFSLPRSCLMCPPTIPALS